MGDARRVLVLGGRGFLGRHVVAALQAAGDEVVSAGRSGGPDLRRLTAEAGLDAVVNCAGRTHGTRSELVADNVGLVADVLDAIAGSSIRLVHIGSSAEYGRGGIDAPVREDGPTLPVGPYGITKLAATQLVRNAGAPAVVLRVFNPVGAGMAAASMLGAAADRMREALRTGHGSISMGDLSAERDFIDARDVADAVVEATRRTDLPPILNVGSGRATRARDLVAMLAVAARFDGTVDESGAGSSRSAGVDRQVADVTAAARHLEWRARHPLQAAVAALWSGGASAGT